MPGDHLWHGLGDVPGLEHVRAEHGVIEAEELAFVQVHLSGDCPELVQQLGVALALGVEQHELADVVQEAAREQLVVGQAEVYGQVTAQASRRRSRAPEQLDGRGC